MNTSGGRLPATLPLVQLLLLHSAVGLVEKLRGRRWIAVGGGRQSIGKINNLEESLQQKRQHNTLERQHSIGKISIWRRACNKILWKGNTILWRGNKVLERLTIWTRACNKIRSQVFRPTANSVGEPDNIILWRGATKFAAALNGQENTLHSKLQ